MEKIAIIGGGISSLSAAYYISRNQNLRDIHIFEKEKELGGRVKTVNIGGCYIDTGAQFLTKEDREAFQLIRNTGIEKNLKKINMSFSFHDGEKLLSLSTINLIKNTSIKEKLEIAKLFAKIKKIGEILESLPADDINSEYTTKTFEAWYLENMGERMLWLYNSLFRSIGFVTSEKISALYGLVIIRALFEQCYSFNKGLTELIDSMLKGMKDLNIHKGTIVEILDSTEFDKIVLSVPFSEAKKLVRELNVGDMEYYNCTYLILSLNKRLWTKDWGIFTPKDFPISFITDETLKFGERSMDNTILGVIVPESSESNQERLLSFVINKLSDFFSISEEEVIDYRIYNWEYALPVCSPQFHQNLRKIKEISLNNVYLCGDYMSLPSLDGAIESGRLAAGKLMQKS
jgi:protoporphyrinogen oxidase